MGQALACKGYLSGLLLLSAALACSGKVANGEGGGGAENAGGASGGGAPANGGTSSDSPGGGRAGSLAVGGSTASAAGTGNDAGADSSAGSAGEGPLDAVRFLLLVPPPPPSTPAGLTPADEIDSSTSYCCASADGSVIVGTSSYVFPRFSGKPSGDLTRTFIWREATGLKDLGPITDPQQGFVTSIEPEYLTADGSRVLGSYTLGGVEAGDNGPVWTTGLGGFFVWTEAQGYTRFGPPEPQASGQMYGFSADGKTALGYVQSGTGSSLGFLWTESDGFSRLMDLPAWPAAGQPVALSRDGSSIAGVAGDSGFLWRKSGFQWLGTVGIWPICSPQGMSADGVVIVGTCRNGSQAPITFRWTEATGMVALDLNSTVQISPDAISERGDVLLGREVDAGAPLQHGSLRGLAFWENGAGMRQVAPSADLDSNYVITQRGLTADGSAAIGTRLSDTRQSGDFQWTKSGGVRDLPPLHPMDQVYALGQSTDGRLVAGQTGPNAVLWDASGVRDIGAELRSAGADLQGWGLSAAGGAIAKGAHTVITYGRAAKSVSTSSSAEERAWIAWLRAR